MTEHIMQRSVAIPSHDFIEALQHPLLSKHRMKSNELETRKMTRNNLTLCSYTLNSLYCFYMYWSNIETTNIGIE